MSRNSKSAASQRASNKTSSVTLAVTLGLPSRSPPIHDERRIGALSSGKRFPVCCTICSSRSRKNSGKACHRVLSIVANPHFASSTGVGRFRRISSVCQPAIMRRRKRLSCVCCSLGVRSGLSNCPRMTSISLYLRSRVRRVISVGWAVKTNSVRH